MQSTGIADSDSIKARSWERGRILVPALKVRISSPFIRHQRIQVGVTNPLMSSAAPHTLITDFRKHTF